MPPAAVSLRRLALPIAAISLVSLGLPAPLLAADTTWSGASSNDWGTAGNWSNGVPTAADHAFLPGGVSTTAINLPALTNTTAQLIVSAAYSLSGSAGAALSLADHLFVDGNAAELVVNAFSSITTPNATVGLSGGSSTDVLKIVGNGVSLVVSGTLNAAFDGANHLLNVDNGATLTAANLWFGGVSTAINNAILINAATTVANTSQAIFGYGGSNNTATVSNGARLNINSQLLLGLQNGANGNSLIAKDSGSQINLSGSASIGTDGDQSQVIVQNGASFTKSGGGDLALGSNAASESNSLIINGGSLSFSTPISSTLVVGVAGDSNLFRVEGGGTASTGAARLGAAAGSDNNTATVTGSGSSWTLAGTIRVGSDGSGNSLYVLNGGSFTITGANRNLWIGYGATSSNNTVTVGGSGSSINVKGSGSEVVISRQGGSNNRLLLLDSGLADVNRIQTGPGGILQFGNGVAAGRLATAATITGNDGGLAFGGGAVVFNHNEANLTIANTMAGPLRLQQLGSGKTTLSGSNTYTGKTEINAGTLALVAASNNISASSAIEVAAGASLDVTGVSGGLSLATGQTLAGGGDIFGNVSIASGSTLAPGLNSIDTLTFHNDLSIAGTLALDLGASSADRIVADALNLQPGSLLQFTTTGPLNLSSYLLAEYTSLTGTFGSLSGTPAGYLLDYDYLSNHQIALVRDPNYSTAPDPLPLAGAAAAWSWSRRLRRRLQRV